MTSHAALKSKQSEKLVDETTVSIFKVVVAIQLDELFSEKQFPWSKTFTTNRRAARKECRKQSSVGRNRKSFFFFCEGRWSDDEWMKKPNSDGDESTKNPSDQTEKKTLKSHLMSMSDRQLHGRWSNNKCTRTSSIECHENVWANFQLKSIVFVCFYSVKLIASDFRLDVFLFDICNWLKWFE